MSFFLRSSLISHRHWLRNWDHNMETIKMHLLQKLKVRQMQMCFSVPLLLSWRFMKCFKLNSKYWNEYIIYLCCKSCRWLVDCKEELKTGLRGNNYHTILFGWFLIFSVLSILCFIFQMCLNKLFICWYWLSLDIEYGRILDK